MFATDELTTDGFLGGRLRVLQPRSGYRAATDPVLLAAAVSASPGQDILDLGCGAGVAGLCLAARVGGLTLAGVELQPAYADLARRNATMNGISLDIHLADIADMPASLRNRRFDHVIANPPFYPAGAGAGAADPGRETALREMRPLSSWAIAGLRRLKPGGWMTVILSTDRLPDFLAGVAGSAGNTAVLPIAAREDRAARRVIVKTRKGARGPFRMVAPLVMHEGAAHREDRDSHTAAARAVLRDAAAIQF